MSDMLSILDSTLNEVKLISHFVAWSRSAMKKGVPISERLRFYQVIVTN